MADERSEDSSSDMFKESKEETICKQSNGNKERTKSTKSTMLIQSHKISSQFASPLTKRSSQDSTQAEGSFHIKRAKYGSSKGDDGNESPKQNNCNEKKKLEDILREKENTLRKLKLVKMYRAKNNLTDLEELIGKWRSICQEAAQNLYEKFNSENAISMGQFLDGLRIKHDLIRYSEEEEAFY